MFFNRSHQPETPTFKRRVAGFWSWFSANADRFHAAIADKRCADLQPEVSEQMNLLYSGASWCFGPSEHGQGHSFTFTAEGNIHKQFLTAYWLSRAPTLPGWTFYAAKSRSPDVSQFELSFGDLRFKPNETWLTPHIHEEDERIELIVWHPLFARIEPKQRWTAMFIYLDEALGEYAVQKHIGQITFSDSSLAHSIPLTELPSHYDAVVAERDWKAGAPGDWWTSYTCKKPDPGAPRMDVIAGSTAVYALIQELDGGHTDPDPLEDTGAEYVYAAIPREFFPAGREVETRGRIEDTLMERFDSEDLGRVVGGAFGLRYGYIDLLLWDGQASLDAVAEILRQQRVAAGASIEHFAKNRAKERLKL